MHDSFASQEISAELASLDPRLKTLENQSQSLSELVVIYRLAASADYENALSRAELRPPETALLGHIDSGRLETWRQAKVQVDYQKFRRQLQSPDVLADLTSLKTLLAQPLLSSELKSELLAWQPELEQKVAAEQITYVGALKKLEEHSWQPEDADFRLVEDKQQAWLYAYYYSQIKNLASSNGTVSAVNLLYEHREDWPKEHPDYQRMNTKYQEWLKLARTRRSQQQKHGFMSAEQIRLLKALRQPIIMAGDLPVKAGWQLVAATGPQTNQYRIVYYDDNTHASLRWLHQPISRTG